MWLFYLVKKLFLKILDFVDLLYEDRVRLRKSKEKHDKNFDVAMYKYFRRGRRF